MMVKELTASVHVFRRDRAGGWLTALVWHPRLGCWLHAGFQYSVIVPDLRRYGGADGLSCGLSMLVDQPAESLMTPCPRRSRGATEAG